MTKNFRNFEKKSELSENFKNFDFETLKIATKKFKLLPDTRGDFLATKAGITLKMDKHFQETCKKSGISGVKVREINKKPKSPNFA